jgi:S1-C subfamily serine protease
VYVLTSVFEQGRKVGENARLAKVVRFSSKHDLALLKVYQHDFGLTSVKFSESFPEPGDKVWHVGSMRGFVGIDSVADGVIAAVGRLRKDHKHNELDGPEIYDQVSGVAHPGSSGGGVFSTNGECLGLVAEILTQGASSSYCMVPSRRLVAYARDSNASWAIDSSVAVPQLDVIMEDLMHGEDIPVPEDWPGAVKPAPEQPAGLPLLPGMLPFPPARLPIRPAQAPEKLPATQDDEPSMPHEQD